MIDFARRLGTQLDVPLLVISLGPNPKGPEFYFPRGERDKITSADNDLRLGKWQPGQAILGVMGGKVAVVDVDPRNRGDVDRTRQMLDGLGVRTFAEVATPGGGLHFYVAGHPELASAHNLNGWPGIDVQSFGSLVFLPGTHRLKYGGAGYKILSEDLDALADGGDPDGAAALAGWVAERRGQAADFEPSPPWQGVPPTGREAAYLDAMLRRMHTELSAMAADTGRNTSTYNAALACGNYIAGAGLEEPRAVGMLLDASDRNGLTRDDGEAAVRATIRSGIRNGRARPRAVPRPADGEPAPEDPYRAPEDEAAELPAHGEFHGQQLLRRLAEAAVSDAEFWESRPVLQHIRDFARARRVGPWALLGCVLVRAVAGTTPDLRLPAFVGSAASLNLFLGVVSLSGGGKGTAESAALDAIELPRVPVAGPGSGEGIAHLFCHYDAKAGELKQHETAAILSAAEIGTMAALKARQASTLFPELRKAWMGEPLGFAYVAKDKKLAVPRQGYRLCLVVGIQPESAWPILADHTVGTPQRFLWMPAEDPEAPEIRPSEPEQWPNPLTPIYREHGVRTVAVCETAAIAVDTARVQQLRGYQTETLDGHALLSQLKVAAALALLEGRGEVTEEDWRLAAAVRQKSDETRQRVVASLQRADLRRDHARAESEARRALHVDSRRDEEATRRAAASIERKLSAVGDWLSRSKLRGALDSQARSYFEAAVEALLIAGKAEEREVRSGQNGTEYRLR